MAAIPRGRQGRPRKLVKGGTTTTRKHRFESFNQRIAKLNIDPIRRRRRNEADEAELEELDSFFRTSLDRWKDVNLSESFTSFTREVDPISNSLPQVLHYNERIFDILTRYIEQRDALFLEPLLDLLANLAHDLGVRFEQHFSRAVTLVASLAAKHTNVEAIEWSFACLTWLFKYLSRLLVPNLRPVFAIMAPLLGREPQKLHTLRFAAEAMSFLVRRAATSYERNTKPLNTIVDAIRDDVTMLKGLPGSESQFQLYQRGLMTLLVNSIKGIERKLYSGGIQIYRCMVDRLLTNDRNEGAGLEDIVFGVTVALIHHCDAKTSSPVVAIVLEQINILGTGTSTTAAGVCAHLLFIVSTVRKGTRIRDWTTVLDAMLKLLESLNQSTHQALPEIYRAAAVILQSSPLDLVIPKFRIAMNTMASDRLALYFLIFCNYFCDLGEQRFQDLMLPYLSKFILSHWQDHELGLCLSLPKLVKKGASNKMVCPAAWQDHMLHKFEEAIDREEPIIQCHSYIELMDYMLLTTTSKDQVTNTLNKLVDKELAVCSGSSFRSLFAHGSGLRVLCHQFSQDHLRAKWPMLCAQAKHYGSLPQYLQAMLALIEVSKTVGDDVNLLIDVLVKNAHSASHELRDLSLQIIDALYAKHNGKQAEVLQTALAIENSPLDLQSARSISMQIRKLGSQYERASSHEWLQRIVPHFCFGMLTFRLSQVWDDAIMVIKKICDTKRGEEVICSLAFKFLEERQTSKPDANSSSPAQIQRDSLTEFQCSNLCQIEDLIDRNTKQFETASEHLQSRFETSHATMGRGVENSPNVALRVLLAVPHVAEKRSRQLVPMFLSWATKETQDAGSTVEEIEAVSMLDNETPIQRLKRKDQKAMLDLFGSFQNPKVLYRSSDVFLALQGLLTNGNADIQKSAVKALFTWKAQGVLPYQENLLNLLDEARFRDEIATFLQVDEYNSIIQEEHRPDLMPIMLRLLYGKMIAGSGTGSKSQAVKRKAVLQALSRLDDEYLHEFIRITLGRLVNLELLKEDDLDENALDQELISVRAQVGLINMMKDMLEVLGDRLAPFCKEIINALLYCLFRAASSICFEENDTEQVTAKAVHGSLLKVVRHTGLQCVNLLCRYAPAASLRRYVSSIFHKVLSPRLDKLPIETAQAVSGILQLFSTWASSQDSVLYLADFDARTVRSIIDCLGVSSAKDEVKLFVVNDILKPIVELSSHSESGSPAGANHYQHETIFQKVLHPNMDSLLDVAGSLLRKSPSKELLVATIHLISTLAPLVRGSSQVFSLLEICTFLLDQPSNRVNPRSKGELLQVIQHFMLLLESQLPSALQDHIFRSVSSLFGYFRDRENRVILSKVLAVLATKDTELQDVAHLCISLNAFSINKIDEPDFDERLKAFNVINETKFREFNPKQWRPILYNMLFYVKDNEELAIRSNASYALRRCVEMNPVLPDSRKTDLVDILLPALRSGVSEASELVRTEYMAIMSHLIRHNPTWDAVNDMSGLLVGDDEEASFFGNVLHIQQHRRLRALRRLASEASQGNLHSSNVAHFFIPLVEHFVFDKADDEGAHNLSAEAVVTIGTLSGSLEWPQFRAVFRRYSGYVQTKPHLEKIIIKLLGVVIDALSQAAEEKGSIPNQQEDVAEIEHSPIRSNTKRALTMTMPRKEKLAEDLTTNLLPALEKYLHDKDESTVSLRVPVAVSVVKLLKLLPTDRLRDRLPPVLTDVCHILRSRAQESRDLTRKTLVDISNLIGPAYFGFVLNELRSSLARGYQLHVLSYTVHSILVATSPIFRPGDLDYCLPQIVAIVMDDIFGVTGQEKDAEEYISKMKEVKSSKSYDSLELVAKTATVEHIVQLIRPLQVLLEEKLDLRMVKKIDELLRRITVGLMRNEAMQDQRVLVFCYEIIREVQQKQETNQRTSKEDYRTRHFLINSKGASKSGERGSTTTYRYKLARFALDLLRSVVHKHDSLQTPANFAGFIPVVGDAIVQPNEEIQTSALRLLTAIIKVPLKALDENAPIYVAECVKIVKASTSTNVEIAQAALKLVSAILRERRTVDIRETDLAYLLKRLIPDLEEPEKQGVAFNFLKAVMIRKIVIPEVYEVLDAVAIIMVTNQTKGARDMARRAYFHFITEYSQSKDRFAKQLGFLVRNLEYKHEEGRQSVMEAVHLLFNKVGEDLVQDTVGTFFVPLVMVVVNDDSSRCREMAGALLKRIFEHADVERTQTFLGLLSTWLGDSQEPLLNRVALQMYRLYLETSGKAAGKEVQPLKLRLAQLLKSNIKLRTEADWELIYFALETFIKICQTSPADAFATNSASLWAGVRQCLSFPHAWVKLSAAKLLGIYFADFARTTATNNDVSLPLKGSGGLWLNEEEIVAITRASLCLLRVQGLSEELASQSVRNLVFLGKIMAQTSMAWPQKDQRLAQTDAIEKEQEEEENSEDDQPEEAQDDTFEGFNQPPPSKPALGHLISQTSRLLRRGPLTTRSPSLTPLHSSLRLLGALTSALPTQPLNPHLPTLLLPLHNLTDPSIPHPFSTDPAFTDGYRALVSNAQELMGVLQGKLGTTAFVGVLSGVREGVRGRREERRVKRRIEMVREPERREGVKRRKGERKRERRKERGGEERGRRRGW